MGVLSSEQISFFAENGYLIIRDLFTADEKANIIEWTNEVKSWPEDSDLGYLPYQEVDGKGRRILCRTENFANYHKGFNELLRGERLRNLIGELSGDKMYLFKEKINYKQAFAGGFDAHFDAPAYNHIKAQKHLTALIGVEDATPENGCLEVVPGSHVGTIPLNPNLTITEEWAKSKEWVSVPLQTGELLIFGSYLAHRSGPNNSPNGRASIYATYNTEADGGDIHDAYYAHRTVLWPATAKRKPGENYEEGAALYAWGTPMETVQQSVKV
ncbi:PhyH-domain-containing protein [Ramaria rubella]|nr:PhyH-domain-containing protein [Ramaria rubella]